MCLMWEKPRKFRFPWHRSDVKVMGRPGRFGGFARARRDLWKRRGHYHNTPFYWHRLRSEQVRKQYDENFYQDAISLFIRARPRCQACLWEDHLNTKELMVSWGRLENEPFRRKGRFRRLCSDSARMFRGQHSYPRWLRPGALTQYISIYLHLLLLLLVRNELPTAIRPVWFPYWPGAPHTQLQCFRC